MPGSWDIGRPAAFAVRGVGTPPVGPGIRFSPSERAPLRCWPARRIRTTSSAGSGLACRYDSTSPRRSEPGNAPPATRPGRSFVGTVTPNPAGGVSAGPHARSVLSYVLARRYPMACPACGEETTSRSAIVEPTELEAERDHCLTCDSGCRDYFRTPVAIAAFAGAGTRRSKRHGGRESQQPL